MNNDNGYKVKPETTECIIYHIDFKNKWLIKKETFVNESEVFKRMTLEEKIKEDMEKRNKTKNKKSK